MGVIGFGRVGRLRSEIIGRHPALELVGVFDPDLDVAPGDPPAAASVGELVASADAIFVCTSNDATAAAAVAALSAGKHVFCEKPPGRSLAEVATIRVAAERDPSLKLKFGFNHRYHEAVQDAFALVRAARFGEILWMRGIYGKAGGPDFEKGWRNQRHRSGGGILLDQGIHMLDLFRLFGGKFDEVKSFVGRSYWQVDVEDNAFALLRNQRGQVAMLHSSSTHWKHQFLLEIFLTEGYLAISGILSGSRSYGRETLITARRHSGIAEEELGRPREEKTYYDHDVSWQLEVDDFADAILSDRPVAVGSIDDAYETMELVERIYAADPSWSGRWTPAEEVPR